MQPDVAEVQPAVEESETPAWMETKAEAETADEVYDGMIRINDVDETPEPEPENFDHVPAGFVDTDAENEYESADPRSSFTLVQPAVPAESETPAWTNHQADFSETDELPVAEDVEEINYELAAEHDDVAEIPEPARRSRHRTRAKNLLSAKK